MDINGSAMSIYNKILKIDPDNANKIMSYILMHYNTQEIMSYASESDAVSSLLINHAISQLYLIEILQKDQLPQHPPSDFRIPPHVLPSKILNNHHIYPQNRIPMSLEEHRRKPCDFYNRGRCMNDNSCKFVHEETLPVPINLDFLDDECTFNTRKLYKLEAELIKLLSENNGLPISIATLPFVYLERYGKNLEAGNYLTEGAQHENTSVILTDLLLQLKNIQLIHRPHGQHVIVLVNDASVYMLEDETNASTIHVPSSHQIYLTFPADCSFTIEDVAEYFNQFGPVREVRIPHQIQRMYGFVTFYDSETVRNILSDEYPHIICGHRVLAKPYKEKTRIADRKLRYQSENLMYLPETNTMPRGYEYSEFSRNQTAPELEDEYPNLLRNHMSRSELNDQFSNLSRDLFFRTELKDENLKSLKRQLYEPEDGIDTKLQQYNDLSPAQVVASNRDDDKPNAEQCSDQKSNHIKLPDEFLSFTPPYE